MSKIYYIIFLQILAATTISFAQPHPVFQHLNTSDGLSNNRVRCILQDSRGFMWFGTDAGLNRYDGKEFLIFKNISADSSSVSGNEIHDLLEDKNGIVWVATGDGGLCSYDYRSGKFSQFHNSFYGNGNEIVKSINAIHENQNHFWVGTDKAGLFLFDKTKGTFQLQSQTQTGFNKQEKNKAYSYFDIISHPDGDTYFGTLVYSLQIFRNREFISPVSSISNPYPAQSVNCIFIDSKDRVWLGAWDNALHQFDKETNSIKTILVNKNKPYSFSEDEIISINQDQNGWLWLGSRRESGLFLFDPETGRVVNYKKKSGDAGSLSSNAIRAIYRDHQNRMWLCTDAGIDVYDPLLNQFETVYLKTIIDDATDDEIVFDFLEDSAAFYIGTNKGLLVRKTINEKFSRKRILYQNENMQVTKLFKDKRNRIFLGTNKTALILNPVDFSTRTMNCFFMREYDQFDFFNIDASRIVDITESNWNGHDVLWFVPYGHGVALFDSENLSGFISTLNIPGNPENLVRSVCIDSKNYPRLLCASKGIAYDIQCPFPDSLKIFFENKNFTSKRKINCKFSFLKSKYIVHDPSIASSINSNNVYDMIENADGTFWITSQGGGLQIYDPRNTKNIFQDFTSGNSDMKRMYKDKNGNLWIITSGGMEFFDVRKNQFHHFGVKDGIPIDGLHGDFYADHSGVIYAGGNGYFLKFIPEKISFNNVVPQVALTHFKIFDESADSLLTQNEIHLSYKNNFFSFEFAALNFTDPDANQYAYKLDGVDQDWVNCGKRNFASYTNLHGGHYVFKVKAANNNGVWNERGISIPVYIKPPLWQYRWFYPSLILLVGAAGFFVYSSRMKRIHRQQEEKLRTEIETQERERVRIAQDLHDDFGTRISALKIYMSTLEKYLDTKSEEAKSVKESAKSIVNEAMTDLRTLLMNLSPKTLEMHGYHAAVQDLVSRLNHTGMFEVELDVPSSLQRFDKKYELALYRITQELLNNSIKHAQCTEVSIQLLKRNSELVLTYSDNGKGFNPLSFGEGRGEVKGFGLKNIENRVNLINGKINWDSRPGKGVNVIVEIPGVE